MAGKRLRIGKAVSAFDAAAAALVDGLRAPPVARDWDALAAAAADFLGLRPQLQSAVREVEAAATTTSLETRQAGTLRSLLRRWEGLESALRAAVEGAELPLYPDRPQPWAVQADILDIAFNRLDHACADADQDKATAETGAYPDIRLPISLFLMHMQAAWRVLAAMGRTEGARFLDVGCGGGGKVLTAARFFPVVRGLELDPGYASAARRLLKPHRVPGAGVIEGNALTFESYGAFEVIYFYAPIRQADLLRQLEEKIAAGAARGTVLVSPYDEFTLRGPELGFTHLSGGISLAGYGAAEAEAVRRAALRTGYVVPDPERMKARPHDGAAAELLLALRCCGFAA